MSTKVKGKMKVPVQRGHADTDAVQAFANKLPDSYLYCREMGHTWRPWAAQWVPEDNRYERILRCGRCKAQRHQALSNTGSILKSRYEYQDGYQSHGLGRITGPGRDLLRLTSLTRTIGDSEEDE